MKQLIEDFFFSVYIDLESPLVNSVNGEAYGRSILLLFSSNFLGWIGILFGIFISCIVPSSLYALTWCMRNQSNKRSMD